LLFVATIRELLGNGSILGITLLQPVTDGGWYVPNGLLLLPPSAFFIIAMFITVVRIWKPEQVEEPEFVIKPQSKGMAHGGGH